MSIQKELCHEMCEIDSTAIFFHHLKLELRLSKIKSVWLRCFSLGNAECILLSPDQDSLLRTSVTPAQLPYHGPACWVWSRLNPLSAPLNLLMARAPFLRDWDNSPSSHHTGTRLNPLPASSFYQSPGCDLSLPSHLFSLLLLPEF